MLPRGLINRKILPQADILQFEFPEDHVCLITDDGTLTTVNLAKDLSERGWKVVVMSYPKSIISYQEKLPNGIKRIELTAMSEEQLENTLDEIAHQEGTIAAFIHLNPLPGADGGFYNKADKAILKHVFFTAKHLKETLNSAADKARSVFMTVSHLDGEFGLGGNGSYDPIAGGLIGLVKTLSLEWEHVFCRALDVSPALDPQRTAKVIISELFDPNRLFVEVAHNESERSTLVVERVSGAEA